MFKTLTRWLASPATPARTARLGLTALEAREVPAVTAVLDAGEVRITGTDAADTIVVRQTDAIIFVEGVPGWFHLPEVRSVRVDARGGGDTVRLDRAGNQVTKPAVVLGGDGDDYLYGGAGNDYVDGGAGDDLVRGLAGRNKLVGDAGNDRLYGHDGDDEIAGGDGADFIAPYGGVNTLDGGDGLDEYYLTTGHDTVYDAMSDGGGVLTYAFCDAVYADGRRSALGWYDANMRDGDLRRTARPAAADGVVTRAEMIAVLENAGDAGSVSETEFTALQRFVGSAPGVSVAESVRQLAGNVVNGNRANAWWTGGAAARQSLGNLAAGSSALTLQRLVDKWFKGADRPLAKSYDRSMTFGYERAAGVLFASGGPFSIDVDQGNLGDCYFLATLAGVARQDPDRVREMFVDNGDGTFTVRFFAGGGTRYVTVDRHLPVAADGTLVFASDGGRADAAHLVLWAALAEKAYAQLNESGVIGQDGTNSYNGVGGRIAPDDGEVVNHDGINGGHGEDAIRHVTAAHVYEYEPRHVGFASLKSQFDAGFVVVFSTPEDPSLDAVAGDHVYTMVGYDAATEMVTLRNPWADGAPLLRLTVAQLRANFDKIEAAAM